MATHSSILVWRILWTEEPRGLQSKGPQRVRHDWVTTHSLTLQPHGLQHTSLSVLHHLPEFAQTYVYWISDAIQTSHPLSSPSPPAFNLSQHQGLFHWVGSGSFSFSISCLNEYSGLVSFRIDGLISLLSKGLWRVFSSTTIRKHQFVVTQPSLWTHSLLYFLQAYQRCHLTLTWVLFSCSVLASKHPSLHPSSVESYEEGAIGLQTISGPLGHSGHCPGHWSVHSDSTSLIVPKISSCCF